MCVEVSGMSRAGFEPAPLQSGIKQLIYPVVMSYPLRPSTRVNILSLKMINDVISDVYFFWCFQNLQNGELYLIEQ